MSPDNPVNQYKTPVDAIPHAPDFTQINRRRRGVALSIVGICLAVIVVAQLLAPVTDNQNMNIVGYVFAGIALVTLVVWSLRRRGISAKRRFAPLVIGLIALGGFFVMFRLEGFTGELEPIFGFRFAPAADLQTDASGRAAQFQLEEHDFPGFLGPQRDGVIPRRLFSTAWNKNRPEVRWRQPIGDGWSGFAIASGFGVTIEQRGNEEWITCYDLADGKLLWHHAEAGRHSHTLGGVGPRSTPTIWDGKVYAQTALGRLVCLHGSDGKLLWRVDLFERGRLDQTSAEAAVTWGRAGSPLVVDQLVVVPFGGAVDPTASSNVIGSLIAFDAATGEERWVGGETQISYASPILATLDGRRQIVSVNESNVTGHTVDTGEVLWQASWPGSSNTGANCASPVVYEDNGILLGKGYGGGSKLLRIATDPEEPSRQLATVDWTSPRVLKTKFTNAVIDGSFAYALSDGFLECVDMTDGSRRWRQGRSTRYGQGQLLRVEDVLLVQAESGEVALAACNPEEFIELARIDALDSKTWNYPAVAGNIFVVRNDREAIAYRLPPREE